MPKNLKTRNPVVLLLLVSLTMSVSVAAKQSKRGHVHYENKLGYSFRLLPEFSVVRHPTSKSSRPMAFLELKAKNGSEEGLAVLVMDDVVKPGLSLNQTSEKEVVLSFLKEVLADVGRLRSGPDMVKINGRRYWKVLLYNRDHPGGLSYAEVHMHIHRERRALYAVMTREKPKSRFRPLFEQTIKSFRIR